MVNLVQLFGTNSPENDNINQGKGQEDVFNQAPVNDQEEGQSQEQGQPNQAPNEPLQTDSGQPSIQNQAQQGKPETEEQKKATILQKFEHDNTKLIDGLVNIGNKLGKQVDMNLVSELSTEELVEQYREAERELGSGVTQQQKPQQPNEVELYRQQVEGMRNFIQQLTSQSQQGIYTPKNYPVGNTQPNNITQRQTVRDPVTGRFVSQNPQQQQAQENLPQVEIEDFDMDKFYDDPNYINQFTQKQIKSALAQQEQKLQETLQQQEQQRAKQEQLKQQKLAQAQQQRALKSNYDSQVNSLKQKYGDQEVQQLSQATLQVLQQRPELYNPQFFPNGFEIAFNEAKKMQSAYNNQQQVQQQQTQQIQAQKQGARIPQSTSRITGQQPNREQQELDAIFGRPERKGVFG